LANIRILFLVPFMETFDLSRLNGAGFERLVRALCFGTLGAPGVVYSSGPDGGRDFTYEGKINGYEAAGWNGYLVVQAKFRETSTNKTDDVSWLKFQLDREYKKFKFENPNLRRPEYYILATNIRLSGADGVTPRGRPKRGGYSKIAVLFDQWKKDLGLKQVDIWSHDKIIDLLASYPEIRQTYAAWITPGDVLSKVLEQFNSKNPSFGDIISRSLKNLLHRDQFVRLKDAGSVGDAQIRTSQVFVDLPLKRADKQRQQDRIFHPHLISEEDSDQNTSKGAIDALVERAREKLDPETLLTNEDRGSKDEKRPQRNRVVIIGGPGQGKSTASTFLAQIFRSAILENQIATKRDHNVKTLIPEILARATNEGISRSVPHRYPVHIALPRFADSISVAKAHSHRPPSLLGHIASSIEASSDQSLHVSDMRNWLKFHPWIVILDGLDEVPPSGERSAVIDAIASFFTEISDANADVLVVVTTRPQGYNKDLDEKLWEHWKLDELKPGQALRYAKAFGLARYPEDTHRRSDIHAQLLKAADQPATARLMISPLQVTILHFIVDTGGGVPTARWTLFNEYFEVLKRREKAKGGETQRILERNWLQLGPIHHRAGLVLQTDSEHAGGAGSKLSHDRFRSIIAAYLQAEGFSTEDISRRSDELMTLALHRFVLLSTQEEGTITFDVRSLQEFMAAAAITSGDQQIMVDRLSHIAKHSHWRHVFLIAASRCFADDSFHYRRPTIVSIPRELDTEEPDALIRNGARLSLDLLADGIGLDHPNSRRPLLQHAFELVSLGEGALDDRLASVWDGHSDLARLTIEQYFTEGSTSTTIAVWSLLLRMYELGFAWSEDLITRFWPARSTDAIQILGHANSPPKTTPMLNLWIQAIAGAGPIETRDRLFRVLHRLDRITDDVIDLSLLRGTFLSPYSGLDGYLDSNVFVGPSKKGFSVKIVGHASFAEKIHFGLDLFSKPEWTPVRASMMFGKKPDKESLAQAISDIADAGLSHAKGLLFVLPWQIASSFDGLLVPN
jgi:hypothetical protein